MTASNGDKSDATKGVEDTVERAQSLTVAADDGNLKTVDEVQLDEAAKYLANAENYGTLTAEAEKRLVRKLDCWMLPMVSHKPFVAEIAEHCRERQIINPNMTYSSCLQQLSALSTRSRSALPLCTASKPIIICMASSIAGWGVSCLWG